MIRFQDLIRFQVMIRFQDFIRFQEHDEDDEMTTSEKFKAIANECCDNIVWEDNIPSGHLGANLPILDIQVWLRDDGVGEQKREPERESLT